MSRSVPRICAESTLLFALLIGTAANGAIIGPGSGNVLANPPTRTSISTASLGVHRIPTPLTAGSYTVDSFSFHNSTQSVAPGPPGSVVPFLARLTNPGFDEVGPTRSYQTIWVGPAVAVGNVNNVDDPGNIISIPYAGSQQFSLAAGENIYAGFFTVGAGRVGYRHPLAPEFFVRSDLDTAFTAVTGAGQNIDSLSNNFYNGVFGFHLSVQPVGGPPAVPGDFDGDTDVDGADFVVWQTNFPASFGKTRATGDADADGDVDGADFVAWQTQFPRPAGGGTAPVPEPAAAILLISALVMAVVRMPRRTA